VVDHVEHFMVSLDAAGRLVTPDSVQLTEAADPSGVGTRAIAFRSRDLARDVAAAEARGATLVARRLLPDGARGAVFDSTEGLVVKLV
jgi:hypothetical protein